MLQAVFRVGLLHMEPTVLKRKLLPLSCGHLYYLMAMESPFFYGGEKGLPALSQGVGVCSRTFEQCAAWLADPEAERDALAWGKTCRRLVLADERARFESYLDQNCCFPERQQAVGPDLTPAAATPCKHPWPLLTAISIMPLVGEARAWNMPVTLAISYASALAERNGDDSLISEADELRVLRAKEEAAARLKNHG